MQRIGMVGLGKLGKVIATSIAYKGHDVLGYDVNPNSMMLTHNEIEDGPNGEPNGFHEILTNSTLKFGSLQEVVDHSDIIFVSVQTPHRPEYDGSHSLKDKDLRYDFDYSYLISAINNINSCNIKEPKVVCIISTVLPSTIKNKILPVITNSNICITYSPAFPAMGTCMKDYLNPEFVLIGQCNSFADNKLKEFYRDMFPNTELISMSLESAELTKVAYNLFITMKITYANTIMEICDKIPNCNCDDVTNALSKAHNRLISPKYMKGGMGDSGGCHPRDAIAMSHLSNLYNISGNLFEHMIQTREEQAQYLADLMFDYGESHMQHIILGTAFKANTKITAGSSALLVQELFNNCYGKFRKAYACDPFIDPMCIDKIQKPSLFLIGINHDIFKTFNFPKGSIILDPFRYIPKAEGILVKYIGVGE